MNMRIALYHNLPSGGAKRALYEWTRRLAATHEIDVYTLSCAEHESCDIRPFVRAHSVFDFTFHRLFESPLGRLNQLQRWRDLGELRRIGRRIANEIDANSYDVLFAHPCLYTFIPAILHYTQTPSVYFLHEPFGSTFTREMPRPYLKEDGWREWSRRVDPLVAMYSHRLERMRQLSVERTSLLLANSQFTRQEMRRAYDVDAPVCHYGVNIEDFRPIQGISKGNHVISVGEMTPRKGFDFLVESLGRLPPNKRPELVLVCNFVSPEEREYVEALASQRDVKVRILVSLNTGQLAQQYNEAQLCVYAPVHEPFGLVPLEAMACGTPVVGVSEGGVRESVRHNETGLLTQRDPRQFAQAIADLLDDPARRAQFGARGREYVENQWQWKRSVNQIEQFLSQTAKQAAS